MEEFLQGLEIGLEHDVKTPNAQTGALLAFSFAMLEVSDSLILAQRQQD